MPIHRFKTVIKVIRSFLIEGIKLTKVQMTPRQRTPVLRRTTVTTPSTMIETHSRSWLISKLEIR